MRWLHFLCTPWLLFLVALVTSGACKPNYPNCESDKDCPGFAEGREFCVNNQCQQCRPGVAEGKNDCGPGYTCNAGRCEKVPGYCARNSDCPSGLCQYNRCVACKALPRST